MAKAKLSSSYAGNTVVDGILYSTAGTVGTTVKLANNNLATAKGIAAKLAGSVSPTFQTLDAQIRALDAQYDLLPDKAPWVSYATAIAGEWQLCANCEPESSGKKLYRQYNFNRLALGLAQVLAPLSGTEYCESYAIGGSFIWNSTGAIIGAAGDWGALVSGPIATAQLGLANGNPAYTLNTAEEGLLVTAGPLYDWLLQCAQAKGGFAAAGTGIAFEIPLCYCTATGAPGLRNVLDLGLIIA